MNKRLDNNDSLDLRDLRVLEEIANDPSISQRDLSKRLGVALGITNSLIKTLARKGMIKIRGENNRSLSYHLTHAGVLHKGKLAMQWTLNMIGEYRRLSTEISNRLNELSKSGIKKVLISGTNELAEVVMVMAPEAEIEIIGIVDEDTKQDSFLGVNIVDFEELNGNAFDAIINCSDLTEGSEKMSLIGEQNVPVYDFF